MMRAALPALALLVASVQPSHSQGWRPVERQCWAETAASASPPCGSCAGQWREVTNCVLIKTGAAVQPDLLNYCFNFVNRQDQAMPMSHDRVVDVIRCLGR